MSKGGWLFVWSTTLIWMSASALFGFFGFEHYFAMGFCVVVMDLAHMILTH